MPSSQILADPPETALAPERSREAALSTAARAVSRSSRKEFFIGLVGVLCFAALVGLLGFVAFMDGEPSTMMLVLTGVAAIPALLMVWYVVTRLKRWRRPETAAFHVLLANPQQITSIRAEHVTYRAAGARLGSEYIVNVSGNGRAGYCRLDAAGYHAVERYLRSVAPQAFEETVPAAAVPAAPPAA